MSENNKSYRIRTTVGSDSNLTVKLDQSYNMLEILSLKINQSNAYKLHSSNYGVIAGRVLANGGFGIPNAKISVFIPLSDADGNDTVKSALYPYTSTQTKDNNGVVYNLLNDYAPNNCYQVVGTFPDKRMVLDNDSVLEIFDTYYKYTTKTNDSGDYMIFGVPVGSQTLHVDIDISDIGILSQRPYDLVYQGHNLNEFENANQFKTSTNLRSLSQLYSQDVTVTVNPFWGDTSDDTVSITRKDVNMDYTFQPTCVFIGSVITDGSNNAITKQCVGDEKAGAMDEMVSGEGTIEMIRKTPEGNVEEFQIKGNQLIDGDGTWCYQIPMNLDYVTTDEYGNMVPTEDTSKGIPTRTRVRFRVSLTDTTHGDNSSIKRGKMLVPNNPEMYSSTDTVDYNFGSATLDDEFGTLSFRDLFWNNVYSVKSYIPRVQKGNASKNKNFIGIKHTNQMGNNSPMPYNNIRIQMPLMFRILCVIIKGLIAIVKLVNDVIAYFNSVNALPNISGIYLPKGLCDELSEWYFCPFSTSIMNKKNQGTDDALKLLWNKLNIDNNRYSNDGGIDTKSIDTLNDEGNDIACMTTSIDYLVQCIEIELAQEYHVINFDFYDDWVNGCIYLPQWKRIVKQKRKYLFGLISTSGGIHACTTEHFHYTRRIVQQCSMYYTPINGNKGMMVNQNIGIGCNGLGNSKQKCGEAQGRHYAHILGKNGGLIKEAKTLENQTVYYYRPAEINSNSRKTLLFATDIILLGSLNDCDLNGLPQAFRYLKPTSYQLPPNLAQVNLNTVGNMYGGQSGISNDYSLCVPLTTDQKNGKNRPKGTHEFYYFTLSPQELAQNFYNANAIAKRNGETDTNGAVSSTDPDFDPYPLTEAAGIDWGYAGPEQRIYGTNPTSNATAKTDYNTTSNVYFPGGHFLGISCNNSEVNIKSCINLQRACELGAILSQKQKFIQKLQSGTTTISSYTVLSPSGFISTDEIEDGDARAMFATLNQNRLKTKRDANGRLVYDISYVYPTSFGGELSDTISKLANGRNNYNTIVYGEQVTETGDNTEQREKVYRRTIEFNDSEYFRFRMGLVQNSDGKMVDCFYPSVAATDKFALASSPTMFAIPQYENSFYFYFGIKDGSTALDKLINQYYANCSKSTKSNYTIRNSKITNAKSCSNEGGKFEIQLEGEKAPFTIRLINNLTQEDAPLQTVTADTKYYCNQDPSKCVKSLVIISNIPAGTYQFVCTDASNETHTMDFVIAVNKLYLSEEPNEFAKSLDTIYPASSISGLTEEKVKKRVYFSNIRDQINSGYTDTGGYVKINLPESNDISDFSNVGFIIGTYNDEGKIGEYITNINYLTTTGGTNFFSDNSNLRYTIPELLPLRTMMFNDSFSYADEYSVLITNPGDTGTTSTAATSEFIALKGTVLSGATSITVPLWRGNTEYVIYAFSKCSSDSDYNKTEFYNSAFSINGKEESLTLNIGSNAQSVNYDFIKNFKSGFWSGETIYGWDDLSNYAKYDWESNNHWIEYGFNTAATSALTTSEINHRNAVIYSLKKAVYNYGDDNYSIQYIGSNGSSPYGGQTLRNEIDTVPTENFILSQNININCPANFYTLAKSGNTWVYATQTAHTVSSMPAAPFMGWINDYSGSKMPTAASEINSSTTITYSNIGNYKNTLSNWFGVHTYLKPFSCKGIMFLPSQFASTLSTNTGYTGENMTEITYDIDVTNGITNKIADNKYALGESAIYFSFSNGSTSIYIDNILNQSDETETRRLSLTGITNKSYYNGLDDNFNYCSLHLEEAAYPLDNSSFTPNSVDLTSITGFTFYNDIRVTITKSISTASTTQLSILPIGLSSGVTYYIIKANNNTYPYPYISGQTALFNSSLNVYTLNNFAKNDTSNCILGISGGIPTDITSEILNGKMIDKPFGDGFANSFYILGIAGEATAETGDVPSLNVCKIYGAYDMTSNFDEYNLAFNDLTVSGTVEPSTNIGVYYIEGDIPLSSFKLDSDADPINLVNNYENNRLYVELKSREGDIYNIWTNFGQSGTEGWCTYSKANKTFHFKTKIVANDGTYTNLCAEATAFDGQVGFVRDAGGLMYGDSLIISK